METVKNLFQKIYDDDEVNLEYRYYEVWNMVLVEMIRSLDLDVTYNITVSPQWDLIREVLISMLAFFSNSADLKHTYLSNRTYQLVPSPEGN